MEPSLQPSFIFPSRQNTCNYATGLLNLSSATQRTLVWPSRNTNIDLQTSLQSPLTRPPTLDKDVIDVKPVLPVDTPLYVQPGLAEGMLDLTKSTKAEQDIVRLTSANNALKRGNYKAAENILGREVTSEEQANLTITPFFRSSEMNPNHRTHVDFITGARGDRITSEKSSNMEKKIRSFNNANEELVNDLATRKGISVADASQLKQTMNYTGDSAVGYTQSTEEEKNEVLDAMDFYHQYMKGMSASERAAMRHQQSIMEGEAQPIHRGKKMTAALKRHSDQIKQQYEEASRKDRTEGPPQAPVLQFPNRNPDSAFSENYDPTLRQREAEAQMNRNWENGMGNMEETDWYEEQTEEMKIPQAPLISAFQGAPPTARQQVSQPTIVYEEPGEPILNQQAVDFTQTNINLTKGFTNELKDAKSKLKKSGARVTVTAPDRPLTLDPFAAEMERRRNGMHLDEDYEGWSEVNRNMAAALDLINEVDSKIPEDEKDDVAMPLAPISGYKRTRPQREEKGGEIGGRPRRTMKRKSFHPSSNDPFLPGTDSFGDDGGVVSGNLMKQTGKKAVPISAQIQVANTHQYTETPLREWVRHPNFTSDVRPDPIPIAQYVGVGKRAKKVKFGGFMMDHNKLLTHNILSLSHPTGKKIKGMPNVEVSPGLRQAINSIVTGGKVNTSKLSQQEKLQLRDLLHRSAANVELGADVNVSPTQQLQLILGEMEAGNDASELKGQLRKLLPQLKRSKVLTAGQVADISQHYC